MRHAVDVHRPTVRRGRDVTRPTPARARLTAAEARILRAAQTRGVVYTVFFGWRCNGLAVGMPGGPIDTLKRAGLADIERVGWNDYLTPTDAGRAWLDAEAGEGDAPTE